MFLTSIILYLVLPEVDTFYIEEPIFVSLNKVNFFIKLSWPAMTFMKVDFPLKTASTANGTLITF